MTATEISVKTAPPNPWSGAPGPDLGPDHGDAVVLPHVRSGGGALSEPAGAGTMHELDPGLRLDVPDTAGPASDDAPAPTIAVADVSLVCTYEERFADLVTTHHARLAHLAYMLCGNRAQAEDAVAEAYARVWPRYRKGHVVEAVPYLRRAVVNQVHGSFRRRALERREEQRCTIDLRIEDHLDDAVHDREMLRPALLALPPSQRAVIVLRFLEDLSEEETASILGVKPGTVKSRTARALEQLRRLVGASL